MELKTRGRRTSGGGWGASPFDRAILLAVLSALAACQDEQRARPTITVPDAGPDVNTAAAPITVPFVKFYESIYVRVRLEGLEEPLLLLYDTGSPEIVIDKKEAAKLGIAASERAASIGSVDLGRRKITVASTIVGGEVLPGLQKEPIRGYAGNKLFEGFSVGVNFRDRELLLAEAQSPSTTPKGPEGAVDDPVEVPFDYAKGYLSIPCLFARGTANRRCLFDTGVMTSLTLESHWKTLPHPRPETLPQDGIDSRGKTLPAYFQRNEATMIGAQSVPGDVVKVASEFELLASVGRSIDQELVGLVGMLSVESLFTTIDYPNRRLLFRRYADLSWTPPSPFVGYGFLLEQAPLRVRFVAPGSSAHAAGVTANDTILEINGVSTTFTSPDLTLAQTISASAGQQGSFLLGRGEETIGVTLTAADMLPAP